MVEERYSNKLLYTERGLAWLSQFTEIDKDAARHLVGALTLVSHSTFERSLLKEISKVVEATDGVVALYAVREINSLTSYFSQANTSAAGARTVDALSSGRDHGSEARVAAMIRNLCKSSGGKMLNHPSIAEMRAEKCRKLVFVDDFIGSGKRVRDFIQSFWCDPSVVSWMSLRYITLSVVTFSGTEDGISHVEKHKSRPSVSFVRSCPTLNNMPWPKQKKEDVLNLCKKYGKKAHKNPKMWLGFRETLGLLIFEHSCPNNVPAILWGSRNSDSRWQPLFPHRTVHSAESSVFPNEIQRGDNLSQLLEVGQERLARSEIFNRTGPDGRVVIIILGLLAKGQRRNSTLSFATDLDEIECEKYIQKCIEWSLVSLTRRLTPEGLRELKAAREVKLPSSNRIEIGTDYYYPQTPR